MLFFYPFAFSGVCTGEMGGIRDRLAEFVTFDTRVLAISCDPVYSLRAFADQDGLELPAAVRLLAARRGGHGVRRLRRGAGLRAPLRRTSSTRRACCAGRVHNAMPEGRDLDEHLRQLQAAGLSAPDRAAGRNSSNLLPIPETRTVPGRGRLMLLLVEPLVTRDASGRLISDPAPASAVVSLPRARLGLCRARGV